MKNLGIKQSSLFRLLSMWFLLAAVASAIESRPSVVTYVDAAGHRRIYSFAEGNTGHLVVNYWDGFSWHWSDQGLPPGATAVESPSAITYLSGSQQRIYVFAKANTGHLVVNYWDGFSWHWADQGLPVGAFAAYNPSAITYLSGGLQRIYVFATANTGHLVVNYWDGFSWRWADQGKPVGTSGVYRPSAITYLSGSVQRIYVFDEGSNGDLVVNYWDGSSWHWADQAGLPLSLSANPSAITYLSGTQRRIYAFVEGINGDLLVNYWDGFSWHWADQGLPVGAFAVYNPSAITYLSGGLQRIYVFAEGSNGDLVVNYWDGSSWHWADQGLPPGATAVETPSAITYLSGSQQRIYVFAKASNGHLVVNYWDGSSWHWADQGNM